MSANVFNSGIGLAQYGLSSSQFPDPFCDAASLAMPRTQREINLWCEFLLIANGIYREALSRVISYFITKVEIVSSSRNRLGDEEKNKYQDFLTDGVGIVSILRCIALDFLCYGNSFISLHTPFKRYLRCTARVGKHSCGAQFPLNIVKEDKQFSCRWSPPKFTARCPVCKQTGEWVHADLRTDEAPRVIRWSPHEMEICHERTSDTRGYIWKIPSTVKNPLRHGTTFDLENCRWEVIEAAVANQALRFDPREIFHLHEDTLAGVRTNGWGLSRVFTNFRQAWYLQVLQRYNEAIALDYVVPFRVIHPVPRPGMGSGDSGEPVFDLGNFRSHVLNIIAEHRMDPATWHVSPVAMEYKALGGDARQLAPKELMDQAIQTLLNSCGIPIELWNASLSLQSFPPAARLFESNMSYLVYGLNRALAWIVEGISKHMQWEPVTARLVPPTIADDITKQMAKMQLMLAGKISDTTALETINVNAMEEARRMIQEQQQKAQITADAQKEMNQLASMDEMAQAAAQNMQAAPGGAPGGAPAPGGMPAQPQGPMGVPQGAGGAAAAFGAGAPPPMPESLEEWDNAASVTAGQILAMPSAQRRSSLLRLKSQNPQLHALVSAKIEETENQASTQGKEIILQQQFGKQGSATNFWRKARRNLAATPAQAT